MKHHLTPQGPKPCRASKRPCPVGGEHYPTLEEAQAAYEGARGAAALPAVLKKAAGGGSGEGEPEESTAGEKSAEGTPAPQWELYQGLTPPVEASPTPPPEWEVYRAKFHTPSAVGEEFRRALQDITRLHNRGSWGKRWERTRKKLVSSYHELLALVGSVEVPFAEAEELVAMTEAEGEDYHFKALSRLASRPDAPPGWLTERLRGGAPSFREAQALLHSPQVGWLAEGDLRKLFEELPTHYDEAGHREGATPGLAQGWLSPSFPLEWATEAYLVREEVVTEEPEYWGERPRQTRREAVRSGVAEKLLERPWCSPEVLATVLSVRGLLEVTTEGSGRVSLRVLGESERLQSSEAWREGAPREVVLAAVEDTVRTYQELAPLVEHERVRSREEAETARLLFGQSKHTLNKLAACLTQEECRAARERTRDRALRAVFKRLEDFQKSVIQTNSSLELEVDDLLGRGLFGGGPPPREPWTPESKLAERVLAARTEFPLPPTRLLNPGDRDRPRTLEALR